MISNKLLLFIFFITINSVFAGKILFLDMNQSKSEKKAALEAAKKKGDTLIVIPEEGSTYELENLREVLGSNQFQSMIISGHSGGSDFTGRNVTTSASIIDIMSAIKESKQEHLSSLYLMGCYTGNKSKLCLWKDSIPNLKFIVGFQGQAPLDSSSAGSSFLKDCLIKEEKILKAKSPMNLLQNIEAIQSVRNLDLSMYISCTDESEQHYLSRSSKYRLQTFEVKDCSVKLGEFKDNYLARVMNFWSGEEDPSLEHPQRGFLRQAYAFARDFEHCLDPDTKRFVKEMDPNSLFFLLFNKDFNQNFIQYNKTSLVELFEDLNLSEENPELYVEKMKDHYRKKIKRVKELFDDPDFIASIRNEIEFTEKSLASLEHQYPNLKQCYLYSVDCTLQKPIQDKYEQLSKLLLYLKTPREIFLTKLEGKIRGVTKLQPDKKLKPLLQKMIQDSSKVTRKDILELDKILTTMVENPLVNSRTLNSLHLAVYDAATLSSSHPMSWHEPLEKDKMEFYHRLFSEPKNKNLIEFLNMSND